jgi:serine/threonine protein kinase
MDRAVAPASTPAAVVFQDGLGERRQIIDPTGTETLELLCLRGELAAVPSFEFALRERVSRLANFRHAYYGRVRNVERLSDREAALAIVSERTSGVRLSDMLANAEERRLGIDINTALCLIRQLVPAVAMLHENARDIAHGAIGPERLVVTPHARLIIVEYVMGAALEQLRFSQERYWNDLRIALPRSAGLPRFDHRTDIMQIGVVALSLIRGRPLHDDEYPSRIGDVVASTWAVSARGGFEPLPPGLRGWLGRALQLDARNAFASAVEARAELDKVLNDGDYMASPASLETFLARYHAAERPTAPVPPSPVPPSPVSPSPVPPSPRPRATLSPQAPVPAPQPLVHQVQPIAESVNAKLTPPPRADSTRASQPARKERDDDVVSLHLSQEAERPRRWPWLLATAAALIALIGGGIFAGRRFVAAAPPEVSTGTLSVTTDPPGAQAIVDGEARGATPLTLTLATGSHVVELRGAGGRRLIPVNISAGAMVTQYVELPKSGPPVGSVSAFGQLQVRTDPPGAQVTVDDIPWGTSPTTVADLMPGEHTVVLASDLGSVKQVVTIEAGMTASLIVPLSAPGGAPVSGWIAVSSPVDLQLYENGRLVGTSQSDRIMVSAGRHEIEVVNDTLGYRATRVVQVSAGKTVPVKVDAPKGSIALNAVPWAEVWIDGENVGETPIGNLPVPIGAHEIIFRHPALGELRQAVTVTLKDAVRLSVDLRRK